MTKIALSCYDKNCLCKWAFTDLAVTKAVAYLIFFKRFFLLQDISLTLLSLYIRPKVMLLQFDLVITFKFNPLSPNSDQHLISPHNITDSSNIHVTRMNEMITKDGMS